MSRSVAVIGAGISGLTIAFELMERSEIHLEQLDVQLFEASARSGGNIRSERLDGFLCEWGPTGFLDNAPRTLTLARRVGLGERMVSAREVAERRFIYRADRLHEVPLSPVKFMRSSVLPVPGRLRLLAEPLIPRRRDPSDESVFDFASRRIGRHAAAILVDSMVSGIFAGDARRLSLRSTFPKMHRMESEHGGLVRAMLARKRERAEETEQSGEPKRGGPAGPGGRLTSFRDGMQELPDALAARLGEHLHTSCPVTAVSDLGQRGFRLHLERGAPVDADAVILAVPAWHASKLLRGMDGELADVLDEIPSAPVSVVHCGFSRGALGDIREGFGFLVPRGQGPRILGTLWPSWIFDGRCAADKILMTTMVGGAHDPDGADLPDERLHDVVLGDLGRILSTVARPFFVQVHRHRRGIPQYTLGHDGRLERIQTRVARRPGLWLCGNSYSGVSVNACVEEAPTVAKAALSHLAELETSTAGQA